MSINDYPNHGEVYLVFGHPLSHPRGRRVQLPSDERPEQRR